MQDILFRATPSLASWLLQMIPFLLHCLALWLESCSGPWDFQTGTLQQKTELILAGASGFAYIPRGKSDLN